MIDDYGHHPVEIAAVLKAARQAGARDVVAVVQPHRYSRLQSLFAEFCTCMNDAGTVIVADVYSAGEAPIPGVNRDALVDGLRARGHRSVVPLPGPEHLAEMVYAIARPGDFVVCLGAGNITQWAAALPAGFGRVAGRQRPPRGGSRIMMRRRDASRIWSKRCRRCAGACRPTRRSRRSPGSASAAPPRRWCDRPTPRTSPRSCARCRDDVPVRVLGACSNLIIRDGGLRGVGDPARRAASARSRSSPNGIIAGAAALDVTVAEHAAAAGLAGLEFLSGIPGTIGGAVAMNAGAYGGDVADVLDWAEIVTRSGEIVRLAAPRPRLRLPPRPTASGGVRRDARPLPRPPGAARRDRGAHGRDPRHRARRRSRCAPAPAAPRSAIRRT